MRLSKLLCRIVIVLLAVFVAAILLDLIIYYIPSRDVQSNADSKYGQVFAEDHTKGSVLLLVPAEHDQYHLLVYKKSLFFDRYRLSEDQIYQQEELNNFAIVDNFQAFAVSVREGEICIYRNTIKSRWSGRMIEDKVYA